ncbi:MAG: phosphate acyltransferase [Candidatus Omnitrophica bacterium]|nr:phosphate acyltransferase [Candidatus Omnitrophota bacterium]
MDAITKIRQKASAGLKTIVLPEYEDKRVVEAAGIIEKEGIAKVLLLTPDKIDKEKKEKYIQDFYQMHIAKGIQIEEVRKTFEGTLYYAAMMTREGLAGGIVAGASHTTPDVARACIRCLGIDSRLTIVSSCFIMAVPDCPYGEEGTFIFADCGIIPEPNARQLCYIAISASDLARKVLGLTPRVGFLSYSTRGSANAKSTEKITEALGMIKKIEPGLLVDGELQVDAAIVPEVAKIKYPDSPLGGKANILIFPDLEAGNIGYKLTQRLAKARAVGPLVMGLNKPASDLSRGCSVDDIVDCAAVTAIRA